MDIPQQISREFNLDVSQITHTLALINEGATVPFIARYRKERTGGLDENQIRDIMDKSRYYQELEDRRQTVLDTIQAQGKLTPDLKAKILAAKEKSELEDLYLPYKPKKSTRASKAREAGLEPLALWLYNLTSPQADLKEKASAFLNPDKGYDTPDKTLQGAQDILAEKLAENADIRKRLRETALEKGSFVSQVKKEFKAQKTKFQMYYDYSEDVKNIPSHRMMALLRGEKEKVLKVHLEFPREKAIAYLEKYFILHPESAAHDVLKDTAADALDRLLSPATETEIRKEIREKSEEEAIKVFGDNLEQLLLAPPAGRRIVLGIDPGFRTGCKMAALDATGRFLEDRTIYPNEPRKDTAGAQKILSEMIEKYAVELIAVGNGTASRETESFVRKVIKDLPAEKRPQCVLVSEAGASVYSASKTAAEEFPDLDVTVRGAISIGRRLQDPLSELVKIDPKSIGVGQYQHDVNQSRLKASLENTVESCVNRVGIDLNLASQELLKYVSGLTRQTASNIIAVRDEQGAFTSREGLKKVPGLGEKAFEQSAGFLRIREGEHPLDNSAVHPERYAFVERMAKSLKTTVEDLIGNTFLLRSVDPSSWVSDDVGMPTIRDILKELEKPGRDPRDVFKTARFSEDIQTLADLSPGMILEGTVTNVTHFGAFVDIGVHQDGLVHISQIADTFVKDPGDYVKVGQVAKVKVLSVDEDLKRISLTMLLDSEKNS